MKVSWILPAGAIAALAAWIVLLPSPSLSQELTAPEQQRIETWLLDNCPLDERQDLLTSLRDMGPRAAPAFIAAFEQGPPERLLSELEQAAGRRFELRQQQLAGNDNLGLDEEALKEARSTTREQFVEQAQADFVNRYKSQALSGLGVVGGPEAQALLKRVASDQTSPLRPAAQEALKNAASSGR